MAFNNNRYDRPSRGGEFKPRFESRGPVEMHKAICDNCKNECEVPFKPTSGKPVFCNNCFKSQGESAGPRRYEGSPRFASETGRSPERSQDRPMFNSVCSDCGDTCKVPFQPNGDKPVFCSNCFGDKKHAVGERDNNGEQRSNPALKDKIIEINAKLDKILSLLTPAVATEGIEEPVKIEKPVEPETEPVVKAKKPVRQAQDKKTPAKKSPVKKS